MAINFTITKLDNEGYMLSYRDADFNERMEYHYSGYSLANALEEAAKKEAEVIENRRAQVARERQAMAGIGGLNSAPTPAGLKSLQEVALAQAYATAEQTTKAPDATEADAIF